MPRFNNYAPSVAKYGEFDSRLACYRTPEGEYEISVYAHGGCQALHRISLYNLGQLSKWITTELAHRALEDT